MSKKKFTRDRKAYKEYVFYKKASKISLWRWFAGKSSKPIPKQRP